MMARRPSRCGLASGQTGTINLRAVSDWALNQPMGA